MRYFIYLAAAGLALSLLTGIRTIRPGEKAIVLRFGRMLNEKPGPGLYVGLPWGIDQVYPVQAQMVRTVRIGYVPEMDDELNMSISPGQLVTGDHNLVNLQAVLDYTVRDEEVDRYVFQQERAEELLARTAETVLSQWVAVHGVDTVLLKGKLARLDQDQSLRDALVEETQRRLEKYELGIALKGARVTYLSPPAAVKEAFEKVYQAETQIKTLQYQAEEYQTLRLNQAKTQDNQVRQDADSLYYQKTKQAQGQAESFEKWIALAKKLKAENPYYLNAIWWDQVPELYKTLRANGQVDLLDHRLGANGLDFTLVPSRPGKK